GRGDAAGMGEQGRAGRIAGGGMVRGAEQFGGERDAEGGIPWAEAKAGRRALGGARQSGRGAVIDDQIVGGGIKLLAGREDGEAGGPAVPRGKDPGREAGA